MKIYNFRRCIGGALAAGNSAKSHTSQNQFSNKLKIILFNNAQAYFSRLCATLYAIWVFTWQRNNICTRERISENPKRQLLGDFKTLTDWMTSLIERVEEIVPKWQRGQMSKHHRVLPVLYNM
jgi:hypothetical protein